MATPAMAYIGLVTSQSVKYDQGVEDVAISEFKAKCLGMVDDIAATGRAITLTKRGQAVARVVPVAAVSAPLRGTWAGSVVVNGDIAGVHLADDWESAG